MRRFVIRLVWLVAVVAAFLVADLGDDATPAAEASQAQPRPSKAGRWIVDPQGRVLILHGVNMVNKIGSYAPDATGFDADDAKFLADNGFNTVRLGLIWRAVEPRPGKYNKKYLERVRRTTKILADQGIWTLLDFHQDLYHERFQGEGAPTWAVLDDGLPSQPQLGFPNNYFANVGMTRAYDNFWNNKPGPGGVGLQDRYAAAWRQTAKYFRSTPGVLGMDLFNEPWPGTGWQACANPEGCPQFDAKLQKFSQRSIDQIRRVDPKSLVFYEPNVLFNNGAGTSVRPRGKNLAFSFHNYCLATHAGLDGTGLQGSFCEVFDDMVWQNTEKQVAATQHAPLLTEFGASDDLKSLESMLDRAMKHRIGWQYWAYCGCDDPTTTGKDDTQALVLNPRKPPRGSNVRWAKLKTLAIAHPTVVSGIPRAYRFDRETRTFRFTYTSQKANSPSKRFGAGSITSVAVPKVQYRTGYKVSVAGARVVSGKNATVLKLKLKPGARDVRVVVRPR